MKKKASLIIGNICSLASKEDVSPYLMKLIAPLQKVVLDPQPEIRAIAAHSMGMLTKEMGENEIQNLLNWLIELVLQSSIKLIYAILLNNLRKDVLRTDEVFKKFKMI